MWFQLITGHKTAHNFDQKELVIKYLGVCQTLFQALCVYMYEQTYMQIYTYMYAKSVFM